MTPSIHAAHARKPSPKTGATTTMSERTFPPESLGAQNTPIVMAANTSPQSSGSTAMESRPKKPVSTTRRSARVHGRRISVFARSSALRRLGRTPWMIFVVSIMLLFPGYATAAVRLHGVVLAVTPKTGQVIVRHDAFGSMPAMTMPFRIVPRDRAAQLLPGATIEADVNTKTEPWTLSNVTSSSSQPLTTENSPLRRVTPVKIGDAVPDTAFLDQAGRPFRFSQLRGQDVVLSFIYTRCADAQMCPLISAKFAKLQELTAKRAVHLVEVTLDPVYDRPPVLERYARAYGADPRRWSLVVGDAEPTLDFAARFGIGAFSGENGAIIHAENTVLIGPDGLVKSIVTGAAWLPPEIVARIDASHGIASNPIARLNLWLTNGFVAVCGNSVAGFSGLADLLVVLAVFGALAYLVYRLARKIFVESP
jgi:protein SCO1